MSTEELVFIRSVGAEIILMSSPLGPLFVGDIAVLQVAVRDPNLNPLTPTAATLTVRDPHFVVATYTAVIVNDIVTANVPLLLGGRYRYKWLVTTPSGQQGALEDSFPVTKPGF